jgi:hypothetical protein
VWIWSIMLVTESKTNIKRPDATGKKVNATHPLQGVETYTSEKESHFISNWLCVCNS